MQQTTWEKGIVFPKLPHLEGKKEADVVIIGGGITGITCAYLLAKAGKKVICIDKEELRYSITACTTAFLASDVDTDLQDLVKVYGEKFARDVWFSGKEAIDDVEQIAHMEGIQCEFMRTTEYMYATSEKGLRGIEKEAKCAKEFGFIMERADTELPFPQYGTYALRNQAKFHPLKYLIKLRERAEAFGAEFYEHTEAKDIEGETKVTVTTDKGSVEAKHVIVSTYSPFNKPRRTIPKKARYISYVYELAIPKGVLPEALYLDDQHPYHYVRVDKGEVKDRMIVGGEDHRHEIPIDKERNYVALLRYVEKTFPGLSYEVVAKWDGPILESVDGLPLIGRYSRKHPNRYVATCFSGNGMTYSMTAAKILLGYVLGETNKYAHVYDPFRKIKMRELLVKGSDYMGIMIHGAFRNFFVKKKPASED